MDTPTTKYVNWFRNSAPYINAHRGRTFVLHLDGDAIDSPGNAGNFIVLMAVDDTRWVTLGRSGVWVDGGAD